jgi:hypothetical protein
VNGNGATPQHSFLVTCVGAYDDSGIGTGGFVCVHDNNATIIDKIDSTGLCASAETYYRFARGLRSIIGYRVDGLRYVLKVPEGRDIHDVMVADGEFVAVSTGTNEVLWLDPVGCINRRLQMDGQGDAWHLNCLCEADGRWYAAAFGRFAQHRGWVGQCRGTGFIMDIESREEVVTGLSGPHNPRSIDGQWVVCDSHTNALVLQRPGEAARRVELGGFTRGLAHDERYFYVGESANRKAQVPAELSSIAVVDRNSLEVVQRIEVPFPEIYEILIVPPSFAANVTTDPARFQVDHGDERFAQLQRQVEIGWKQVDELKRRLEPLLGVEYVRGRLVELKRRVLGK